MHKGRVLYYLLSLALCALAVVYCFLVYRAGQLDGLDLGSFYLIGIPNYYFFYTVILPFFVAGVFYLGLENRYIRLFGDLSEELDENQRNKVLRWRKVLPIIALLFSALVIVQDAREKNHTLPPYEFHFASRDQARTATERYACAKKWRKYDNADVQRCATSYLSLLQRAGLAGKTASGFPSFALWWTAASRLSRFESLLSLLATLSVSFFVAELLLLIIVKNYVKPATGNLIMWMLILISVWFPTKNYSVWSSNLGSGAAEKASIFLFGLALLGLGVLIVIFIRTARNNLEKYGSIVAAVFSAGLAALGFFQPKVVDGVLETIRQSGFIYVSIAVAILGMALFLVTDYFIDSYEQEIGGAES